MDANTVTLVVGLGAIATSGLGVYFVVKARSSKLREMLYSRQINLSIQIISNIVRMKNFLMRLENEKGEHKVKAIKDLYFTIVKLSTLTEESAAILPSKLWIEIRQLSNHVTFIFNEYYEKEALVQNNWRYWTTSDLK
jgi:hypothetical protein